MTSSMLSGERRWASARRGGMTVLGKVAVPKPINLPSQRLENHGLDPNVEIVPKGTHSWGTRSSSSGSNAWGSSASSPNNDGGTGSPSYLSGRPSSGSGTRPSTAGSDRNYEPIASAWGSNSRPSSASGALTSNQASLASLRPRSAETRPGSSQLSRFAEPSDNSVAWSATGMAEKLGVTSKNDGFSLSSGDFPTLGSEKEPSDHGSHGRPGSSSGGGALVKEMTGNSEGDVAGNSNVKGGTPGSWRRESPMHGEDGARPTVEKWHTDPQLYSNSGIPPHQYDTWHGPPVNSHPGGVWYRGPPGGPPFGSPVGPGGFPMEPFPYYRPQIPPPALANPQPVPPQVAGPRGPRPKNGDMYRPRMPDPFIRSGIQMRPGFYPGPVPYDSYYGPPMGYCNSNSKERDIQFVGMPMGPAAYNRYSGQNPSGPGGYGPSGKGMVSEQVECNHSQDARGAYNGHLKRHDDWEGKDEQKWDDTVTTGAPYPGKADYPRSSSWENGWRADHKKDEELDKRRTALGEEAYSESVDNQVRDFVKAKPTETVAYLKASDDSLVNRLEQADLATSVFPEVTPVPRDASLIQKIEGLNAKARASEGRQDVHSASSREEQKNKLQVSDVKSNYSANEVDSGSGSLQSTSVTTALLGDHISARENILESTVTDGTNTSRRSTHGMHGRADHRGRGKVSTQENDSWPKKSQVTDLPVVVSPTVHVKSSVAYGLDHVPVEANEKSGSYSRGKDDAELVPVMADPSDSQSQRTKMRELALAKQRLEKEEEERKRDQRAKAHAKLEELNRRMQGEVLSQKLEIVPNSAIQNKQEEWTVMQPTVVPGKSTALRSALGSNPNSAAQSSESSTSRVEKSTSSSSKVLEETRSATYEESVIVRDQSEMARLDINNSESMHSDNDRHFHDSGMSKQKRVNYRKKHNSPLENNSTDMLPSSSTTESSKGDNDVAANAIVSLAAVANNVASKDESILPLNPSAVTESSMHHKRKSKTGKNKHKMEETSSTTALPPMVSKDTAASDTLAKSSKSKISEPVLEPSSVQSLPDFKDTSQATEHHSLILNDEAHARVNSQWKPQHARRTPRNPHSNKSTEKFQSSDAVMWAPVRSQNKTDISDEASQKTVEAIGPSIKNDQQGLNNPRNKRAEMERYIPKPAVKEMAQQVSSQQSVGLSINQAMSDETAGKSESSSVGNESSQMFGLVFGKIGFAMESKNGDGKQSKSGKVHGAWRQRGTAESATGSSNPSRTSQKPFEHQPQKSDASPVKEQSTYVDEWSASDGWNIPENSDATVAVPVVKDQGITTKGKRQPHKGHKGTGYNHDTDEKRPSSGEVEVHQSELPATPKENRPLVDRSASHWQPKSNSFSANTERVSRSNNGGQNVGVGGGRVNRKDSIPQGGLPLPQPDKESVVPVVKGQHHHDQSVSEKSNLDEAQVVGHQDAKRVRKTVVHNEHPGGPVDPSSNMDARHDRGSSGFRKNGNQNSRSGREHEFRGDWSGSGKGNKQQSAPVQRERQRHGSHFEYQPVASHNNNRTDNFEPPKDGSYNSYGRYREKGQIHSRRGGGNFNARQTGNVRVDVSYD